MNNDLLEYIIGLLFSIVIWIIVKSHRRTKRNVVRASLPPQHVVDQHIAAIQKMRSTNAGYHEQLNYLLQQGMSKEAAENLIVHIEKGAQK